MRNKEKRITVNRFIVAFSFLVVFLDWLLQFLNKSWGFGTENRGVSFGLGDNLSLYLRFFVPTLLAVAMVWLWKKGWHKNMFLAILIVGGVGNVVPRLFWGYVWDYIEVPYLNLWVNLSDVVISIAVLSYILVGDDRDSNSI